MGKCTVHLRRGYIITNACIVETQVYFLTKIKGVTSCSGHDRIPYFRPILSKTITKNLDKWQK